MMNHNSNTAKQYNNIIILIGLLIIIFFIDDFIFFYTSCGLVPGVKKIKYKIMNFYSPVFSTNVRFQDGELTLIPVLTILLHK